MNDPDVKLDREILAKIHNQVKQHSDRMDYLCLRLDSVTNWIDMHTKHHMDHQITVEQSNRIDGLEKKIDLLIKQVVDHVNDSVRHFYSINKTSVSDDLIVDIGIYSHKDKTEDK